MQTAVTAGYFRAMSIALARAAGCSLKTIARTALLVAIVNDTAARRYWPGEDPIGKRFAIGSRERFGSFRAVQPGEIEWREIVGVVSDVRSAGFAVGGAARGLSQLQAVPALRSVAHRPCHRGSGGARRRDPPRDRGGEPATSVITRGAQPRRPWPTSRSRIRACARRIAALFSGAGADARACSASTA